MRQPELWIATPRVVFDGDVLRTGPELDRHLPSAMGREYAGTTAAVSA